MLLARLAGWRPSKRQPGPGNEVLWHACAPLHADDGAREADATRSLTELAGGAPAHPPPGACVDYDGSPGLESRPWEVGL